MHAQHGDPKGGPIAGFDGYGLEYGDALTEVLHVWNGELLDWEPHYFELMAAMRMLRIKIPATFSPEFLENYVMESVRNSFGSEIPPEVQCCLRVIRSRRDRETLGGDEAVFYRVEVSSSKDFFLLEEDVAETNVYLEHRLPADILSGLSTPKPPMIGIAEIFATENDWADAVLLNEHKRIARSLRGDVWVIGGDGQWKTPSWEEGAPRNVYRKRFLDYINSSSEFTATEGKISPFELNTSRAMLIQQSPFRFFRVSVYKRKEYDSEFLLPFIREYHEQCREKSPVSGED